LPIAKIGAFAKYCREIGLVTKERMP